MAKVLGGRQAVPLEEVVLAQAFQLEALMNVLERHGVLSKAEDLVWPTIQGAWTAILSYAHYTAVQPGKTAPPGINVTYPHDTHHPVVLDGADVVAAFRSQVQELELGGELGPLTVSRVAEPPGTPLGGPPTAGWTILTHSGSDAERRAWQPPIGQETL